MAQFADDYHALKTGFFIGLLMKAGISAYPEVDDEGNYLPVISLRMNLDDGEPPIELMVEVLP